MSLCIHATGSCCTRVFCDVIMMASSYGSIFRVTGPLCGEFTGHRWILLTKASDAELGCFWMPACCTQVLMYSIKNWNSCCVEFIKGKHKKNAFTIHLYQISILRCRWWLKCVLVKTLIYTVNRLIADEGRSKCISGHDTDTATQVYSDFCTKRFETDMFHSIAVCMIMVLSVCSPFENLHTTISKEYYAYLKALGQFCQEYPYYMSHLSQNGPVVTKTISGFHSYTMGSW